MRIVRAESEVKEAYERAKSEAKAAFGNDEVYVEKLIENPKHIEVQVIGDKQGNVVHLLKGIVPFNDATKRSLKWRQVCRCHLN